MADEIYIEKGGQRLRCGYTTGSCAAAASKAALIMLLTGKDILNVSIMTPKGIRYTAEITDIKREKDKVSCAVIKDGGDDPDVTNGMKIYSEVTLEAEAEKMIAADEVIIEGGAGIGRVTKPGLDRKVGEAAINSVPRSMIRENLLQVLDEYRKGKLCAFCDTGTFPKCADLPACTAKVLISAPEGERIAEKTFNPRLGILGGISILGTTGIVEPMSDKAITDTIRAEVSIRKEEGFDVLLVSPGNYGMKFLSDSYGIPETMAVMSSNFIYDTVEIAVSAGFKKLLFAGHIGKLVKVAGGIKNTHSAYGDHRMEILSSLAEMFAEPSEYLELKEKINECVVTDEALRIITKAGIRKKVADQMARMIKENLEMWSKGLLQAEVIVFAGEYEELVSSSGAREMMREFKGEI